MIEQNAQVIDLLNLHLNEVHKLLTTVYNEEKKLPKLSHLARISQGFERTVLNTQLDLKKLIEKEYILGNLKDPNIILLLSKVSNNLSTISGVILDYFSRFIETTPIPSETDKMNKNIALGLEVLRKKIIKAWTDAFNLINKKRKQQTRKDSSGIQIVQ